MIEFDFFKIEIDLNALRELNDSSLDPALNEELEKTLNYWRVFILNKLSQERKQKEEIDNE